MINKIKKVMAAAFVVMMMAVNVSVLVPAGFVGAAPEGTGTTIDEGVNKLSGKGGLSNLSLFGDNGIFFTILNTVFFLIGLLSVIMIVYGGVRYTMSGGDSAAVTAAKNTILYAVIGLAVSLMAFAISKFVIDTL